MNNLRNFVADNLLPRVEMPAQYTGGEWNSITKDHDSVEVSIALAFPDTYSIGMSHLGMQILYFLLNSMPGVVCERVFAPWPDMEGELRKNKVPLFSLETYTPLAEFDIIGFSLQYEMSYTNVLNMLDLANIPLKRDERGETNPIIIAGGPTALAPEPMADFIDIFVLGEGEDLMPELMELFKKTKQDSNLSRSDKITLTAKEIKGLYAPQLYDVTYHSNGLIDEIKPNMPGLPASITKAVVQDFDNAFMPEKLITPYVKTTHDRIAIEIMRGCTQGCRFCNAGMTKRPKRTRSVDTIIKSAETLYNNTGYDEISLTSLSTSDYPDLKGLMQKLHIMFNNKRVNISFPSLRASEELANLPSLLNSVRKSGLTIALEAAGLELRKTINKNITNEDLFNGVKSAYKNGWKLVKLYFMIGLPMETDEEIDEIIDLAYKVSDLKKEINGSSGFVNISIATFVPKPHTPFQWQPMATLERIREVENRLREKNVRRSKIKLRFHNPGRSYLEGVFARGDRRLGSAILQAWKDGCRFDAWDDYFNYSTWEKAFKKTGIDCSFYANRTRQKDETLPWDHIDASIHKSFLEMEEKKAFDRQSTQDCSEKCVFCGACEDKKPRAQ